MKRIKVETVNSIVEEVRVRTRARAVGELVELAELARSPKTQVQTRFEFEKMDIKLQKLYEITQEETETEEQTQTSFNVQKLQITSLRQRVPTPRVFGMRERRNPTPIARYVPSEGSSDSSEEHSSQNQSHAERKFEPIITANSLRSRAQNLIPPAKTSNQVQSSDDLEPTIVKMPPPTIRKSARRVSIAQPPPDHLRRLSVRIASRLRAEKEAIPVEPSQMKTRSKVRFTPEVAPVSSKKTGSKAVEP